MRRVSCRLLRQMGIAVVKGGLPSGTKIHISFALPIIVNPLIKVSVASDETELSIVFRNRLPDVGIIRIWTNSDDGNHFCVAGFRRPDRLFLA